MGLRNSQNFKSNTKLIPNAVGNGGALSSLTNMAAAVGQNTGSQSPKKDISKGLGGASPAPLGGNVNVLYRNNYAAAGLQT